MKFADILSFQIMDKDVQIAILDHTQSFPSPTACRGAEKDNLTETQDKVSAKISY